jgi:hypothetical protein
LKGELCRRNLSFSPECFVTCLLLCNSAAANTRSGFVPAWPRIARFGVFSQIRAVVQDSAEQLLRA